MTLDELIEKKAAEYRKNPLAENLFSADQEGDFIGKWEAGFRSIEFFSRFRGITHFGGESGVRISVHPSDSSPFADDEQPFFWNGKINGYAAESAVARAYGLITEMETADFMLKKNPRVIFSFVEGIASIDLAVEFIDGKWIVEQ